MSPLPTEPWVVIGVTWKPVTPRGHDHGERPRALVLEEGHYSRTLSWRGLGAQWRCWGAQALAEEIEDWTLLSAPPEYTARLIANFTRHDMFRPQDQAREMGDDFGPDEDA